MNPKAASTQRTILLALGSTVYMQFLKFKNRFLGAEELAQLLKALAALSEDLGLVPGTHIWWNSQTCLEFHL